MKRLGIYFFIILLCLSFILNNTTSALAITIRSGDSVYIAEDQKNLQDLYLFGNTVTIDAPVRNDLITAGNSVTINGDVTGSVMTAGSDVYIRSRVGNTLRAAGGTVAISAPVNRDALIAGGNIRIAKSASISGDLLIAGGQIQIDAPVKGQVYIYGGDVTINNTIGGNVKGKIGALTLGSKALINGNLSYESENKAVIQKGALVKGKNEFKKTEEPKKQPKGLTAFVTTGTLYKLAIDIVISLLLIFFLPVLLKKLLGQIVNAPLSKLGSGFLFLVFWPLLSLFLLILLWLGLASFLLYAFLLLMAAYLSKILLGWWLIRWWQGRNKLEYTLDWKAAIAGPLAMFIISLIPIIGWLVGFIIFLMSLGVIIRSLFDFTQTQRVALPVHTAGKK